MEVAMLDPTTLAVIVAVIRVSPTIEHYARRLAKWWRARRK
jgi:hypothetical protein